MILQVGAGLAASGVLLKASEQWLHLAMRSKAQTHFRIANLGRFLSRFFQLPRVAWIPGWFSWTTRKTQPTKTTRKPKTFQKNTWFGCKTPVKFCLEKINMPKKQMKSFFKELYRTNKPQKWGKKERTQETQSANWTYFFKAPSLKKSQQEKVHQKVMFACFLFAYETDSNIQSFQKYICMMYVYLSSGPCPKSPATSWG